MTYLDQLFDEVFDSFFTFPERSRQLLTQMSRSESQPLEKRFPSHPVSNIYLEKDGKAIFEIAVPGFDKEDIKVEFLDGLLTVKAQRQEEMGDKDERMYFCQRLARRNFEISYKLPTAADTEKIESEMKNGILKITIPVKEEEKKIPKQIPIQ